MKERQIFFIRKKIIKSITKKILNSKNKLCIKVTVIGGEIIGK